MKKEKTFEVITRSGKSKYVSATSKKQVKEFFVSEKPKDIIERKDISPDGKFKIS